MCDLTEKVNQHIGKLTHARVLGTYLALALGNRLHFADLTDLAAQNIIVAL